MVRPAVEVRPFTGIRVVVVSHGPPMRGGIASVALDLVEDPALNDEFEMVFYNTSQNDDARGAFGIQNLYRAVAHSFGTFRRARRGAVVHTHSVQHPVFVAWRQVAIALAARIRGARVLLHNHAGPPAMLAPGEYRVGRTHRAAFALLDRLADANILITAASEGNLRPYMRNVALPVIENSVVVQNAEASTADHLPPVVLFVGELVETKGLVVLMDAFDLLEKRGCGAFDLRIVGDDTRGRDPAKDQMIELLEQRGHRSRMTGALTREQVYRHFSESDLFVLPTFTEGQPFTVIESLAAGVPIVATDIPAISAMITDGVNGRLVPVGDAEALADAIEELLDDPERRRRISATNRELAAARFDRSVFRDAVAELYRRSGRPGSAKTAK